MGPDGPGRCTHPSKKVGHVTPFIFQGDWARLGPLAPPKSTISHPNWEADRAQKPYTYTRCFALSYSSTCAMALDRAGVATLSLRLSMGPIGPHLPLKCEVLHTDMLSPLLTVTTKLSTTLITNFKEFVGLMRFRTKTGLPKRLCSNLCSILWLKPHFHIKRLVIGANAIQATHPPRPTSTLRERAQLESK